MVVWPWNILMIIYLYQLALKRYNEEAEYRSLLKPAGIPVLLAWGVLPALNFVGAWDNYLSCSLYSGKLPLMAVCVEPKETVLKPYVKKDTYALCEGKELVRIQSWAISEMNVPPYPEVRVYRKIAAQLKTAYPTAECYLYYYGKPEKTIITPVD
jgi:hypothetical protein